MFLTIFITAFIIINMGYDPPWLISDSAKANAMPCKFDRDN